MRRLREQVDQIERRLRSAPISHLGPIAHGWTTQEPSACDLCWIADALREIRIDLSSGGAMGSDGVLEGHVPRRGALERARRQIPHCETEGKDDQNNNESVPSLGCQMQYTACDESRSSTTRDNPAWSEHTTRFGPP